MFVEIKVKRYVLNVHFCHMFSTVQLKWIVVIIFVMGTYFGLISINAILLRTVSKQDNSSLVMLPCSLGNISLYIVTLIVLWSWKCLRDASHVLHKCRRPTLTLHWTCLLSRYFTHLHSLLLKKKTTYFTKFFYKYTVYYVIKIYAIVW